jgi:hypothetical protein
VEAHEIAEKIHEHAASDHGHEAGHELTHEWFRRLTGIYIGVVAMLLAITTLGGAEATRDMLNANIHASDTYAFYQAKYIRQLNYQTAAEQLSVLAAIGTGTGLPAEARSRIDQMVAQYRDTAKRYESEPQTKNGKKELLAQARRWEHVRDHAAAQIPNFEYAEALFQIAIVLGSVAIVAASAALLVGSSALAVVAVLLTANGYLLLVPLAGG